MNLFSKEKRMNLAVITYHNNGGLKLFTLSVRVRGLFGEGVNASRP